MDAPGGHTQITTKAIGKRINQLHALERHITKLPLTAIALDGVLETPTEYAIRRLRRAEREILLEKISPNRNQLIEHVGMRNEVAARSEVNEVIEDILAKLTWIKPNRS